MLRLILLRHAKAASPDGVRDHDRPLAPRGIEAMPHVARWLDKLGTPIDLAMVSPALRTRQTWELAEPVIGVDVRAVFEPKIYEARPSDILAAIQTTTHNVKTLMVVGHNPGLESLIVMLAGSADADARRRLSSGMSPGSVAVLDCPVDSWRELRAGTSTLSFFTRPRDLGADG